MKKASLTRNVVTRGGEILEGRRAERYVVNIYILLKFTNYMSIIRTFSTRDAPQQQPVPRLRRVHDEELPEIFNNMMQLRTELVQSIHPEDVTCKQEPPSGQLNVEVTLNFFGSFTNGAKSHLILGENYHTLRVKHRGSEWMVERHEGAPPPSFVSSFGDAAEKDFALRVWIEENMCHQGYIIKPDPRTGHATVQRLIDGGARIEWKEKHNNLVNLLLTHMRVLSTRTMIDSSPAYMPHKDLYNLN